MCLLSTLLFARYLCIEGCTSAKCRRNLPSYPVDSSCRVVKSVTVMFICGRLCGLDAAFLPNASTVIPLMYCLLMFMDLVWYVDCISRSVQRVTDRPHGCQLPAPPSQLCSHLADGVKLGLIIWINVCQARPYARQPPVSPSCL